MLRVSGSNHKFYQTNKLSSQTQKSIIMIRTQRQTVPTIDNENKQLLLNTFVKITRDAQNNLDAIRILSIRVVECSINPAPLIAHCASR